MAFVSLFMRYSLRSLGTIPGAGNVPLTLTAYPVVIIPGRHIGKDHLSPICSPFTISTVFTDVRPSFHLHANGFCSVVHNLK